MPHSLKNHRIDNQNTTSLANMILKYIRSFEVRGLSKNTIESRKKYLFLFYSWCEEYALSDTCEISREILESYQRYVSRLKGRLNDKIKAVSQYDRLIVVKGFFKWLTRKRYLLYNPASELDLPRVPKGQFRDVLSPEEINQLLSVPDLMDPLGLRDRVIIEVFYSTGIRRQELAGIHLDDVYSESEILRVRAAKGENQRLVPLGERALKWVEKYLADSRPYLICGIDSPFLFLNKKGQQIKLTMLNQIIAHLKKKADITKPGSCHLLRHTMATHMLRGGADIRYVQQILGHSQITTTERYTHLTIDHLKAAHKAAHPLENPTAQRKLTL